jgi:hypothetical protein
MFVQAHPDPSTDCTGCFVRSARGKSSDRQPTIRTGTVCTAAVCRTVARSMGKIHSDTGSSRRATCFARGESTMTARVLHRRMPRRADVR